MTIKKNKKTKKTTKSIKNNLLDSSIITTNLSPLRSDKFIIPSNYNSLYNKLKYSVQRYIPSNKNIKLKINNLEEDNNDTFFPYKCNIDLFDKNENIHIQFETFLSDIICNYTIHPILFEKNNIEIKKDLVKDDFSNIKGYNNRINLITEIMNVYLSAFSF